MNEELKTLNESLEQKVLARTYELEAMASRYRFMTKVVPQIVWTANPQGELDYFNQTWYGFSKVFEPESLNSDWSK